MTEALKDKQSKLKYRLSADYKSQDSENMSLEEFRKYCHTLTQYTSVAVLTFLASTPSHQSHPTPVTPDTGHTRHLSHPTSVTPDKSHT